jgi:AAA domain, putative AbiEii toxin, Type IV TA system/PHP domain
VSVTFQEVEVFDNGAQFYDADLHVHSFDASHDVKDSSMTVEAIVDSAIKIGIRILAITDHNNDANTARSIDYARKYSDRILVIAGAELTTANGHLLVYFDPSECANVRNLLGKTNIIGQLGDQDAHTAMSMADAIKEAERLGGICIAAHIDRVKSGFEMLSAGYPNWKRDIITSSGLYGLEFDNSNNLDWYSYADQATANGAERKKLIAARANLSAMKGRPDLARVQGSDAHSLANFVGGGTRKIITRFKLNELTFDAFRTALADCEARVRAVATIPRSLPRILGVQVTGGFLNGETFHFSDNLNCFIGGRGTGKSSALQTLAYGLGIDDAMEDHDNCPGTVVIYCEDQSGVRFRYERVQGSKPIVKAKDEGEITEVPEDAFRVEYYRQGELAEVAKNPLKHPVLLQEFLDRHLLLNDLLEKECQLADALAHNGAQLVPLEGSAGQLSSKRELFGQINKKLAIAEEGKLKDIVAEQTRLANEKSLSISLGEIRDEYKRGLSFSNFRRDYESHASIAAPLTDSPPCEAALAKIKAAIEAVNQFLTEEQKNINERLSATAKDISSALSELKLAQMQLEARINTKVTELQKKGLSGSITELQNLLQQRAALTLEINKINGQAPQLSQLKKDREQYLEELATVRAQIMERRKSQLASINQNLAATIQDYTVFVHYDAWGIIDEFKKFILEKMQGTYFHEDAAVEFCRRLTPAVLAEYVLNQDIDRIGEAGNVDSEWAGEICKKLRYYNVLHTLETMWKTPCPVISVKTKGNKPKTIPVNQLSDGQKHTIMLTIAMLAESNIPLIIDQPEDDLDNAFIFSAVVKTLREIKERRQVILVTHNANIAVLGDAELILPMKRSEDGGTAFDRGAIDRGETKKAVLDILEGGDLAFQRRREIYGH